MTESFADNKNCELKFPFEIRDVDPATNEELLRDFTGEKDGYVEVGPKRYLFQSTFKKHADHFYNFQARKSDIWVSTYPRSGTTWTQELVWMIENDLDYEAAQREVLTKRFPAIDDCLTLNDKIVEEFLEAQKDNPKLQELIKTGCQPAYETLPLIEGRRFIKTHLPFSLLPLTVMERRAKVIYVARNPKDVAVSYYHLLRVSRTTEYIRDFPKFWDYFERDLLPFSPYWDHVQEGWENRHEPNVLFMFYEDMNKDLPATIRKVATFLDKTLTDDQVSKLANHLSIENFRNNPSVNRAALKEMKIYRAGEDFIRNGKTVPGWQKEYTPEVVERAQRWIAENLKKTDVRFPGVDC